ncbi:unnamed protein product [Toxocara canis]|uniref:Uncharacterized protein n=1 Tax=Toxocara canis TaxID=6265 RepID=A0A183UQK6_TOXCA|nr:unnamed protein product [Toxocara canis]
MAIRIPSLRPPKHADIRSSVTTKLTYRQAANAASTRVEEINASVSCGQEFFVLLIAQHTIGDTEVSLIENCVDRRTVVSLPRVLVFVDVRFLLLFLFLLFDLLAWFRAVAVAWSGITLLQERIDNF